MEEEENEEEENEDKAELQCCAQCLLSVAGLWVVWTEGLEH